MEEVKEEEVKEEEREGEGEGMRDAQEAIEETGTASPSQPHVEELTVKVSKIIGYI